MPFHLVIDVDSYLLVTFEAKLPVNIAISLVHKKR
jgi:hypothetical protein